MDTTARTLITEHLCQADGLLVTAGAGMGVDSGLPDFRGQTGFWKAYPALAQAGIQFETIANPASFRKDPRLAWGFYGHRLRLYRETRPHRGFRILQDMGGRMTHGLFVFTSNVDGQFQKSGLAEDRIDEVHGSIHHLQCLDEHCPAAVWSAADFHPEIDVRTCRLLNDLPTCRHCGGLARPNILMFGDWAFHQVRQAHQDRQLQAWLRQVRRPVVIEIGAGTNVPTVRLFSDRFRHLIRINPREPQVHGPSATGLALPGLQALEMLEDWLAADSRG